MKSDLLYMHAILFFGDHYLDEKGMCASFQYRVENMVILFFTPGCKRRLR